MNSLKNNNSAQMMVLESVIFAVMVITSIFFVYQLSPTPTVEVDTSSNQLKIIGDDALRTIDKSPPDILGTYYSSQLVEYISKNESGNLTTFLDKLLPNHVSYNIYISNGTKTILWYNGEVEKGSKIGLVSRSHRTIAISELQIDKVAYYPVGKIIPGYDGAYYDVILEMWYI